MGVIFFILSKQAIRKKLRRYRTPEKPFEQKIAEKIKYIKATIKFLTKTFLKQTNKVPSFPQTWRVSSKKFSFYLTFIVSPLFFYSCGANIFNDSELYYPTIGAYPRRIHTCLLAYLFCSIETVYCCIHLTCLINFLPMVVESNTV